MRSLLTALMVVLTISFSAAQEREAGGPDFSLRTSLLSIMETDANLVLGVGARWNSRWEVITEAGYVFLQPYATNSGVETEENRVRGIKLRTEFRYYFRNSPQSRWPRLFVSTAFHYKYVNALRWAEFGMNCEGVDCDFFQIDSYNRIRKEIGGLVMLGASKPLFDTRWLAVEWYLGYGLKYRTVRNTSLPPGGSFRFFLRDGIFGADREGIVPMVPIGMKLVFKLNNREKW